MTATEEDRQRIYAAFGLTAEDVAEFESTATFRSYAAAQYDADEFEAAFRNSLAARAADVSAELTAKLFGLETPTVARCGGLGPPVPGCGCSFCVAVRPA